MTILSVHHLRSRIAESGAAADIIAALGLSEDPAKFAKTAPDADILAAFNQASVKSESIRQRLHRRPFPDFARLGIYTGDNPDYHLDGGFGNAADISRLAAEFGVPVNDARNVLDFGCGTSRILRYLVEFIPGPQYYGSEVFEDNVKWGTAAFPEVRYLHQGNLPPLPLASGQFDLVYAYSIFSHLDENSHHQWLGEFSRIIRAGGLLIITVQSVTLLNRCRADPEMAASLSMTTSDLTNVVRQFEANGFAFHRCYDRSSLAAGGLDANTFGLTYLTPEYLAKSASPNFEILLHDEGAIAQFQDWVVLRRL
jgi:SAM-dependent methyltransferase